MKVSVFGLGYVGSVSAAMLASDGHDVIGVDLNPDKVAAINAGASPIVEPGLGEALQDVVRQGRLRATTSTDDAVRNSEISLICVGTPSRRNGSLDLGYVERVAGEIGGALREVDHYHVVVVRSTVLPGTTHDIVIPALESGSGKTYGEGFGVSMNPEFLREGTALKDFRHPPLTLIGHNHAADASGTTALYAGLDAPVVATSIRTAEMIKYTSNTWHALKVCFANEIGNLCKRLGVDSHDVMDIFCKDDQLALLPQARLRLRRVVPAQGRPRAAIPSQGNRRRDASHLVDSVEQPVAGLDGRGPNPRHRAPQHRPARVQLQGGHG
jgi:GDP-mannose 6-dehydrogenase